MCQNYASSVRRAAARSITRSIFMATISITSLTAPVFAQDSSTEALVESAQRENSLLIYSSISQSGWQGVLDDLAQLYPWMTVEILELGSPEIFARYNIEKSSNAAGADILAANLYSGWVAAEAAGDVAPVELSLSEEFPEWGERMPGVYTFSINPQVLVYNKLLIPEDQWPTSLADVAELVASDPKYAGKVTTYTPEVAYGADLFYAWVRGAGEAGWNTLQSVIPATRFESGGGTMLTKVTSGEYLVGYMLSGSSVLRSASEGFDRVVGWTIPQDGVAVGLLNAGVMKSADSPASAQLFLDYVMSEEGQAALPRGGLNPVIGQASETDSFFTYDRLVNAVGEDKIYIIGTTEPEASDAQAAIARVLAID